MDQIRRLWNELYGDIYEDVNEPLQSFLTYLDGIKSEHESKEPVENETWYKDAVVYSTYADLFNKDINGLKDKLGYIQDLGVNCLWLLPILESPMKDAGFDISNYEAVRPSLLGLPDTASQEEKDLVFSEFIEEAHKKNIKVIFDIAMNHCSVEHEWFKEARKSKESPYRDYFIWSDNTEMYKEARIIFKGMCTSNWEMDPVSGQYFFHRFFDIQPDLNYRNPEILLNMTKTLINWQLKGVDGFRADAVPYIWKEEGTICENLPKTHTVVRFFRAVLDYLRPGTLLLAEACQPPIEVVEYFGDDNECNAAYHFPVMPRIYKALAEEKKDSIEMVMQSNFTPEIPKNCQWFMFLRCHDELTLEMVTPEERKFIYDYYVKNPLWDFRQGEGISARLADLFDGNADRLLLAYSIMFTLLGTPIVYYGDEFAKGNDYAYFEKLYKETGYKDTRYLARGTIDWPEVDAQLKDTQSVAYKVYNGVKHLIHTRNQYRVFGRGELEFIDVTNENGDIENRVLSYIRKTDQKAVVVLQNLSSKRLMINSVRTKGQMTDVLGNTLTYSGTYLIMEPFSFYWCEVGND